MPHDHVDDDVPPAIIDARISYGFFLVPQNILIVIINIIAVSLSLSLSLHIFQPLLPLANDYYITDSNTTIRKSVSFALHVSNLLFIIIIIIMIILMCYKSKRS